MAKTLKGINELIKSIEKLKEMAEIFKADILEPKQEWLSETSDKYQESDNYSEWEDYLSQVEAVIESIEDIDTEMPNY